MTYRVVTVALILAILVSGCRAPRQSSDGGALPKSHPGVRYEEYVAPRFAYTIRHPDEWFAAGSHEGDYLQIASMSLPDVVDPSIRVFVTVTDLEKGLNTRFPSKDEHIGHGDWPHMSTDTVEDTLVTTATGQVPGYLSRGSGVTRGVRYNAIGLDVYGTGHSIRVVCSSGEGYWSTWESVCEEVVRTFVAGNLSTPRNRTESKPISASDLASLRELMSPTRPSGTFAIPQAGGVLYWMTPTGGVLFEESGTTWETLSLVSTLDGSRSWVRQHETATVEVFGTQGVAVYAPSGLELISPEGKELFRAPFLGPGYVRSGGGGRLFIVEYAADQSSKRYHVLQPSSGDAMESIQVEEPFRVFEAAKEDHAVLLSCPDLRLMQGQKQVWHRILTGCADPVGISDDGEMVYAVLSTGASAILQVLGPDGALLWERQFDPAKENFAFSSVSKRFWFRYYDGPGTSPSLELIDEKGQRLQQWSLSSKEDNVLAVNGEGTLAVIRLGDDILALTDEGRIVLRIVNSRFHSVMLHETEMVLYTIHEAGRVGFVFELAESGR